MIHTRLWFEIRLAVKEAIVWIYGRSVTKQQSIWRSTRAGQTEQAFRNWIAEPHPPMPNFGLGAAESDDIASYIMSLKQ